MGGHRARIWLIRGMEKHEGAVSRHLHLSRRPFCPPRTEQSAAVISAHPGWPSMLAYESMTESKSPELTQEILNSPLSTSNGENWRRSSSLIRRVWSPLDTKSPVALVLLQAKAVANGVGSGEGRASCLITEVELIVFPKKMTVRTKSVRWFMVL